MLSEPEPEPDAHPARAMAAAMAVVGRVRSFLFMGDWSFKVSATWAGKWGSILEDAGKRLVVALQNGAAPCGRRCALFYVRLMDSSPGEGLPGR
jgi:hypothetical protein